MFSLTESFRCGLGERNFASGSNMAGPRDCHSEGSQSEKGKASTDPEIVIVRGASQKREKQVPYDVTCMWDLKSDTKELIYETDSQTQKTNF